MNRSEVMAEISVAKFVESKFKPAKTPKMLAESKFRSYIRNLLKEADEKINSYESTGINVLANLLKNIIPVIETDYKLMTTSVEQRKSFAVHLIENTKLTLETSLAHTDQGDDGLNSGDLGESSLEGEGQDTNAPSFFIDIDAGKEDKVKKEQDKAKKEVSDETYQKIDDQEETGYKVSMDCFKKVKSQIFDAYAILSDSKDQEMFYDFIAINLKKHFNLFEHKISGQILFPEVEEQHKSEQEINFQPTQPSMT